MKKFIFTLLFISLKIGIFGFIIDSKEITPLTESSKIIIDKEIENSKKIIFVTTWCHKCQNEIKKIEDSNLQENFLFIFGNYGPDNTKNVSDFLENHSNLKYVFFDRNNVLKDHFNVKIVPYEVTL